MGLIIIIVFNDWINKAGVVGNYVTATDVVLAEDVNAKVHLVQDDLLAEAALVLDVTGVAMHPLKVGASRVFVFHDGLALSAPDTAIRQIQKSTWNDVIIVEKAVY